MASKKFAAPETEEAPGMLHIPDKDAGMRAIEAEVQAFIIKRIRELNGVDENDPTPICAGCYGALALNLVFGMVVEASETRDSRLAAYLAIDLHDNAERMNKASAMMAIAGLLGLRVG